MLKLSRGRGGVTLPYRARRGEISKRPIPPECVTPPGSGKGVAFLLHETPCYAE